MSAETIPGTHHCIVAIRWAYGNPVTEFRGSVAEHKWREHARAAIAIEDELKGAELRDGESPASFESGKMTVGLWYEQRAWSDASGWYAENSGMSAELFERACTTIASALPRQPAGAGGWRGSGVCHQNSERFVFETNARSIGD